MGLNLADGQEKKEPTFPLIDLDHTFARDDEPIDLVLAYEVVEAKMEDFEKVANENRDSSRSAIKFAKDRIRALEDALEAEQAQREIQEAKMGMLESRIQALEGVLSLRDGKMSQAETLFDHSAQSIEKAKAKLENFAESIKKSPFIESVLEKINYSKSQVKQGIEAGKELKVAFVEDVQRVASFMGKMASAVRGIPAKVKKAATEKAISIAEATQRTVRLAVNEVSSAATKVANIGKATQMTTTSFVSGLARKAKAGLEAIANDFSANLSQIEAAAAAKVVPPSGGAVPAELLMIADEVHSLNSSGISHQAIVSQLQNPSTIEHAVHLQLQKMDEKIGMAVARGEDCNHGFDTRQKTISQLLDQSPWIMHPDHGCISRSDAEELDSQHKIAP